MNYITPFDDYPIHQAIEPITIPGPTDRNFYDRYFFNGMDPENEYIFEIGIGLYPNRHVIDAHFSISYKEKQYSFHASQRLDQARVPIKIGPMTLTVDEPMNELTFVLDDPDNKLNCNLKFSANSVAHQEPRSLMMEGTRTIMNTIRFTQLGKWTGTILTEAGSLTPTEIYGIRDRSWGVRPVGEPEGGAPGMLNKEPGVYWCWAPVHFKNFCTQFGTFQDNDGNTTQISGHKLPLYDDMTLAPGEIEVETIHSLHHSVNWQKGTRWATGANISGQMKNKDEFDLKLNTFGPIFFCKGIGYQHDEWKHGIWKGELETGYEVWDLTSIDPGDYTFFHTHQMANATLGSETGIGMLENLVVGRHDPSGFKDFFDGAE